jgi:hypothetical protein
MRTWFPARPATAALDQPSRMLGKGRHDAEML